jgi:hypothetical protein
MFYRINDHDRTGCLETFINDIIAVSGNLGGLHEVNRSSDLM